MNKILTIIQKTDQNAFDRWGANRDTMFQNKDYVQFKTKAGVVKIDYDSMNETYIIDAAGQKIKDLYYDQVIDALDKVIHV